MIIFDEDDIINQITQSNNLRQNGENTNLNFTDNGTIITKEKTLLDKAGAILSSIPGAIGDFAVGAVKGMPIGASKAGEQIMDTITNQAYTKEFVPFLKKTFPVIEDIDNYINNLLKPEGTAQEVGSMIGEATTQIVAPGAMVTKSLQGANLGGKFITNVLGYGSAEALALSPKDQGLLELGVSLFAKNDELKNEIVNSLKANEDLPFLVQKLQKAPQRFFEGGIVGEGIGKAIEGVGVLYRAMKGSDKIKNTLQNIGEKAQGELDLDGTSSTLSSMGGGEINTALNTHLAKLAKNRNEAPRKVDEMGFYSKALEETKKLKQEKGTGEQFKSMLLKAGVKQDEIDWSGLDEVLSKDKVTKQEIVDQLEANEIELEEVVKTGKLEDAELNFSASEEGVRLDDLAIEKGVIPDKMKSTLTPEESYGPEYINDRADEIFKEYEISEDFPFEGYSIDDAYNKAVEEYYYNPIRIYQDEKTGFIITGNDDVGYSFFRNRSEANNFRNALKSDGDVPYSLNEAKIQANDIAQEEGIIDDIYDTDVGQYSDYTLDGGTNYQEILLTYGRYGLVKNKKMRETGEYTGPHFDEENIIAHIRTKDRMYGDKKVLYIEEIQSDWGQQARKKGLKKSEEEMKAISSKRKQAQAIVDKYEKQVKETGKDLVGKELDEANQASNYLQETQNFVVANDQKVPKAPFITDTNKWTALALKRIISKASEEGYDAIAITPGSVHVNRWNTPGLGNYYDNVIPKVANQVVGKLGGKVSRLPTSKDTDLRDTPSGNDFKNMEAFDGALLIDLTPQVKDKAKKGQALFAVPVGASAVGVTKEQTLTNGGTDGST